MRRAAFVAAPEIVDRETTVGMAGGDADRVVDQLRPAAIDGAGRAHEGVAEEPEAAPVRERNRVGAVAAEPALLVGK